MWRPFPSRLSDTHLHICPPLERPCPDNHQKSLLVKVKSDAKQSGSRKTTWEFRQCCPLYVIIPCVFLV